MQHQKLDIYIYFFEWKGGPRRGDRAKGTLINGIAKIIMTYQNSIKNDQCLPENTKVETVTLIGLYEMVKLESNIPGQGIP